MAKVGTAVFLRADSIPHLAGTPGTERTRNTRKDEKHESWRARVFRAFRTFVWFVLKIENTNLIFHPFSQSPSKRVIIAVALFFSIPANDHAAV